MYENTERAQLILILYKDGKKKRSKRVFIVGTWFK